MRSFNPEKELYKIQHGTRNKIFIGVFLLLLIISISSTYALYQVRYSKRIIYTKVSPFSNNKDLILSVYLDGEKLSSIPEKGTAYYDSIVCENDEEAIASWDYKNWKLNGIYASIPNKCDIKFTSTPSSLITQIQHVKNTNSEMVVEDDTIDKNLRYIGKNPDNFIWFNCDEYDELNQETANQKCEKWRIIGLFNKITKTDGMKESLVKVIRDDSIGNIAWSSDYSSNWTTSTLQKSLNGAYYNGTKLGNGKGITQLTRDMIEQVKWNLGGQNSSNTTAAQYYTNERGTVTYGGQPSIWDGYIGLMYSSDYGYATSGSGLPDDTTTNREGCLTPVIRTWMSGNYNTYCAGNDWLFDYGVYQWTLTHRGNSAGLVNRIENTGYIDCDGNYGVGSSYAVRPALYLKSNIGVASGNGSEETPYILVPS